MVRAKGDRITQLIESKKKMKLIEGRRQSIDFRKTISW